MKKAVVFVLAAAFFALLGGAYVFRGNLAPIEAIPLPAANATSYVFDVSRDEALRAIEDGFADPALITSDFYRSLPLESAVFSGDNVSLTAETRDGAIFGKSVFLSAGDTTDVFIHSFGEPLLSRIYCARGARLPFRDDFAVTVRSVGTRARVSIKAVRPRVLKGIGGFGTHGAYSDEIAVKPTSIEEYSLLVYVGHLLKTSAMPPIRLPSRGCPRI